MVGTHLGVTDRKGVALWKSLLGLASCPSHTRNSLAGAFPSPCLSFTIC